MKKSVRNNSSNFFLRFIHLYHHHAQSHQCWFESIWLLTLVLTLCFILLKVCLFFTYKSLSEMFSSLQNTNDTAHSLTQPCWFKIMLMYILYLNITRQVYNDNNSLLDLKTHIQKRKLALLRTGLKTYLTISYSLSEKF